MNLENHSLSFFNIFDKYSSPLLYSYFFFLIPKYFYKSLLLSFQYDYLLRKLKTKKINQSKSNNQIQSKVGLFDKDLTLTPTPTPMLCQVNRGTLSEVGESRSQRLQVDF